MFFFYLLSVLLCIAYYAISRNLKNNCSFMCDLMQKQFNGNVVGMAVFYSPCWLGANNRRPAWATKLFYINLHAVSGGVYKQSAAFIKVWKIRTWANDMNFFYLKYGWVSCDTSDISYRMPERLSNIIRLQCSNISLQLCFDAFAARFHHFKCVYKQHSICTGIWAYNQCRCQEGFEMYEKN